VVDTYYGVNVPDPYRWLENLHSPQTKQWIAAEDAVTNAYLAATPTLSLIRKSAGLTDTYDTISAPEHHGRYWVRWIWKAGSKDDLLYVSSTPDARGGVLLDPKAVFRDRNEQLGNYVRYDFSPNGRYMAYSTIISGSDWETWHIRDVARKRDLPETLRDCAFASPAWANDSSGFYYVHYPAGSSAIPAAPKLIHPRLYVHRIGTLQPEDRVVFAVDAHPDWFIGASSTADGRFLIIGAGLGEVIRGQLWAADLTHGFKLTAIGLRSSSATFVGNDGPRLYFLTSEGAPRRRVVAVDLSQSTRITTVVAQQADTAQAFTLLGNQGETVGAGRAISLIGNRFYLTFLHEAHTEIRVFDLHGHAVGSIPLPGIGTADAPTSGSRWDRYAYYTYTSNATPDETYRYDTVTGKSMLFWKPTLSVDTTKFVTDLVFAVSKDGTRVPLFVTRQRGQPLDENAPTLLWGYGGADYDNTPRYSESVLQWVEMGGIYAIAVVRGGTELGETWHTAAAGPTKQRSFDDFIACAEKLIHDRYTSPRRLAAYGASDGGLLVGAAITQRPDLFGAAVAEAGSYDMIRGDRLPGDCWPCADYGSADASEAQFRSLFAYSPYHHVRDGIRYPAMLIITGDRDDRVSRAHSLKFAAALQHAQAGSAPILLYVQVGAGHYAAVGPGEMFAFLTKAMDFTPRAPSR
jgi:prolyl oligopeptidase